MSEINILKTHDQWRTKIQLSPHIADLKSDWQGKKNVQMY